MGLQRAGPAPPARLGWSHITPAPGAPLQVPATLPQGSCSEEFRSGVDGEDCRKIRGKPFLACLRVFGEEGRERREETLQGPVIHLKNFSNAASAGRRSPFSALQLRPRCRGKVPDYPLAQPQFPAAGGRFRRLLFLRQPRGSGSATPGADQRPPCQPQRAVS